MPFDYSTDKVSGQENVRHFIIAVVVPAGSNYEPQREFDYTGDYMRNIAVYAEQVLTQENSPHGIVSMYHITAVGDEWTTCLNKKVLYVRNDYAD
jgi:hypothetical protein